MDLSWTIREKLALASAVVRNGNQNWSSISRLVKPLSDVIRPPDWFTAKSCASEYRNLQNILEAERRVRKDDSVEVAAAKIMEVLRLQRIEELRKLLDQKQEEYKKILNQIKDIEEGKYSEEELEKIYNKMKSDSDNMQSAIDDEKPVIYQAVPITTSETKSSDPSNLASLSDSSQDEDSIPLSKISKDRTLSSSRIFSSATVKSETLTDEEKTTQKFSESTSVTTEQPFSFTKSPLKRKATDAVSASNSLSKLNTTATTTTGTTTVIDEDISDKFSDTASVSSYASSSTLTTSPTQTPLTTTPLSIIGRKSSDGGMVNSGGERVRTISTKQHRLSPGGAPSPALSDKSDFDIEKYQKQWRKSIMFVYRAAASHRYANVFLHPVTEDIAPGYHKIVHKPMDLSTIRRNIESGVIKNTNEFQRDMQLMFLNAMMYNHREHEVHKMAVEMYDDVMHNIQMYVEQTKEGGGTPVMIQYFGEPKNLRPSRGRNVDDKDDSEFVTGSFLKRKRFSTTPLPHIVDESTASPSSVKNLSSSMPEKTLLMEMGSATAEGDIAQQLSSSGSNLPVTPGIKRKR